jgi:DNA-3-methyladenine glycosylase
MGSAKTYETGGRSIRRLSRGELPRGTVELARFLIGKTLVHDVAGGRLSGRIVETEAYVVGDAAGHAYSGETPRNRSLFLDRGRAYVYFVYGMWYMMNVASESLGVGAGVLLRALEPVDGLAAMRRRRGAARDCDLARGPGRLCTAMQINRRQDGADLCGGGTLWLGAEARRRGAIGKSVRIGLTREVERVLRFYERGNPCVSGSLRLRK